MLWGETGTSFQEKLWRTDMGKTIQNEAEFSAIQENLAKKIDLSNRVAVSEIKTISAIDLAYWNKGEREYAVCCIVTVDCGTKGVTEVKYSADEITVPYIPGFLSFRELPLVLNTYKLLEHKLDLLMFDGNGYLHHRHMGIATHAAIELDEPAIGVAKSYLKIGGVDFIMPKNDVGVFTDITLNGEVSGRALRTRRDVKPMFVSCGNWISLDRATEITLSLVNSESRQPLPLRLADIETRKIRSVLVATNWNV